MKKREKTEYGYIDYRKKRQLFMTVLMVIIGILIYILGCALNKGENTNVFTVAAILMVLPGAKYLVNFVVLFPFHTPAKEEYEKLKAFEKEGTCLYSDLVITSPEKVMNLDFLLLKEGCVMGVIGKKSQELPYIQKYLSTGVRNWGTNYRVKIYGNYKELLKGVEEAGFKKETAIKDEKEFLSVEAYLKSLIV